jgi:SAM-dependent methyltransferase
MPKLDEYAAELRHLIGVPPWCVDSAVLTPRGLEITGWAVPPDGDASRTGITINDVAAKNLQRGFHRPDVAMFYWFMPGAEYSGFRCLHVARHMPAVPWRLEFVDNGTGRVVDEWHTIYVQAESNAETPVPELAQIIRVHGGNTQCQFLVEGYSAYVKLEQVLYRATSSVFADHSRILDFGCGCGRVARYLAESCARRITGTDIDRENVEWCRRHLPGEFVVNEPAPPLPFEQNTFDCVIANDVFSHFPEDISAAWLAELRRVCRDGGILIVTIASSRAFATAHISADHFSQIHTRDFIDLSANGDLTGVLPDTTFYRNVFHTHAYIRRRWAELGFRIVSIVPGVIGNQLDVVVLQKAAGTYLERPSVA